ncbi:hypothetical protein PPL_06077 [Heterostelium album PN500]|uniref:Uncharacterized protein n=1 Tax=Heterostelium pallidum (strain ATCC 26659 / Pp 5 / PN500) TaxID=670386 RepID=D3BC55_HETP5|nr:hypothetical protein PPL_06077 [Heterostelium album PN500]EFA81238.1 hypothetical protein PPL_06077 [Heterostelium album PN500]|eukprot:XP_020433356.1 hypothetical protein PPL_06077 [Heterostelium album PN500]
MESLIVYILLKILFQKYFKLGSRKFNNNCVESIMWYTFSKMYKMKRLIDFDFMLRSEIEKHIKITTTGLLDSINNNQLKA